MHTTDADMYVPGVCNINRAEIASRRKAGYVGVALFIVGAGALFALHAQYWYRILLFVPVFIAAIGFLQAKNKFCVAYATSGVQNATESSISASKITDKTSHDIDRRRARRLNLQATAIALLVVVAMLLIPS